jgi:hypothetical protein
MNHTLATALATSRERELRTVVRRPERLMAHVLELEEATRPLRRTPRPSRTSHRLEGDLR